MSGQTHFQVYLCRWLWMILAFESVHCVKKAFCFLAQVGLIQLVEGPVGQKAGFPPRKRERFLLDYFQLVH